MSKAAAAEKRKERLESRLGEKGSDKRQARRKLVIKIYGLLTKTPADDSGLVEGTPFSHTGVSRLMSVLEQRAQKDDSSGGKVAKLMLKFLAPEGASDATVSGASVEKLQWVAKMGARFSKK